MSDFDDCTPELKFIGLRIAYFRKLNNLTQNDLAQKVFINKNYLSQIESGSANKALSLPLLIRIARALDVELATLIDMKDLNAEKEETIRQIEELKLMFDEVQKMNDVLDKMLIGINNFNPTVEACGN
ncbi:MAG: helix-turn-helix transcriptional regulator [Selenomonadaceae bacterium]|nr:helix-turn-helix transcriptional regulator [Selenomonadaceae bacterium]